MSYVIGDIHGSDELLARLLDKLLPTSEKLIFLGDYVNKGAQSRAVIDRLLILRQEADIVTIQGNHDRFSLQILADEALFARYRTVDFFVATLESYLPRELHEHLPSLELTDMLTYIPPQHLAFLANLAPYYQDDELIAIHAGLDITLPLDAQPDDVRLRKRPWEVGLEHYPGPKWLAVGHTPTQQLDPAAFGVPLIRGRVLYMDTAPVSSGRLCAVHLPSLRVVSSD
jgi:serine/threonine protein phosphatase 1